jgi:hypothetical protein
MPRAAVCAGRPGVNAVKHLPFQSPYRQAFEVVEQRQGPLRLYPHTDQLPLVLRALNLEFYGGLPGYIARVDERGDGFHKILLKEAAGGFCSLVNGSRKDELRLFSLLDPDLVCRVTIVQQMTCDTSRGPIHSFRFYGGEDFFPEIYLAGKRVLFTDHVLQRFSSRVANPLGADLTFLLMTFFGSPPVSMGVGKGRAFICIHWDTVVAFTYNETDEEILLTTCLTINEINSLTLDMPPRVLHMHYGPAYTRPRLHNWLPYEHARDLYRRWEQKVPLPPRPELPKPGKRGEIASTVRDLMIADGHGPTSQIRFLDDIPGPQDLECRPSQVYPEFDEAEFAKRPPQS